MGWGSIEFVPNDTFPLSFQRVWVLSLSGGFTPCRHLRPSSGREHTTGRQSPSLFDKWHKIFYMPSRIDDAGHTKTFDYPVTQTRLDIPRPLITQSHRHGWTYQGLWLPRENLVKVRTLSLTLLTAQEEMWQEVFCVQLVPTYPLILKRLGG